MDLHFPEKEVRFHKERHLLAGVFSPQTRSFITSSWVLQGVSVSVREQALVITGIPIIRGYETVFDTMQTDIDKVLGPVLQDVGKGA